MGMHRSIREMAIRFALVVSAGAGVTAAQAADAAPAGVVAASSAPTTVQINNVINGGASTRGRRGPAGDAGPPGPPGASGPAGPAGVVQVVQSCASCASGDGQGGIPYGALLTALVGGLFGLLGLVITKENKTSEFRQAWVDALRNDISDFASGMKSFMFFEMRRQDEDDARIKAKEAPASAAHAERELEYVKLMKDAFEKTVLAMMRIRLRINPADTDELMKLRNNSLLEKMVQIQRFVNADHPDFDRAEELVNALHETAAPILKAEWERVKRGERSYVVAKNSLVGLLAIGGIVLLAALVRHAL